MGRPIGSKNKTTSSKSDDKLESISENDVKEVFKFASNYYSVANGSMNGVFTPDLVNAKLQNITTNPLKAKEDIIKNALLDPNNHEQELIGMSEFFELTDMMYKRALLYMSNLPSFDYTYSCINFESPEDFKSKEYKEDCDKMKKFFSKFNVKQQFQYIFKQLVRQESGYYLFRKDGLKYQFQELPQQYCKITGKWDCGLLFDFNMYWFVSPGVDINMYPKVMKKMLSRVYDNSRQEYNPANPLKKRDGTFSYWSQTSPLDGFWAFKFNIDNYSNIPFLSPTFSDAVLRPLIRQLQTNQYIISAQKIMVGLIPFLKDVKSGSIKDQFAISPSAMGQFLGMLKQGISDVIKVGGVPFEDVKVLDFKPNDKDMLESYSRTSSGTYGVTSRAIYADDRMTAAEIEASKDIDGSIVKFVYSMFEDFLNFQVNSITKKFKFKFKLEGLETKSDRKERFEQWHKNASVGVVLPQKLAASIGMTPWELESQLLEANKNNFSDNLISLVNLNTMKSNNTSIDDVGRPKTDANSVADSTERKVDE